MVALLVPSLVVMLLGAQSTADALVAGGVDGSPPPTTVGRVVEIGLVDADRTTPAIGAYPGADQRDVLTTVYLPPTTEPAPLIVLAHGFDGHPRKFTDLAAFWADAGYVVAVPRFPVSNDEFIAAAGGPFFSERVADLDAQALDVSFVIDELLALDSSGTDELGGRIDHEHIGLFGLSLGSLTVWITVLGDPASELRVDALIQSDGGFPGETPRLADVTFPVFVTGSDVDPIFPPELVLPQFDAMSAPKFMLVLHGAAHAAVGENTVTSADEAYRVATTVFWNRYLGGHPDEPFPDSIVVDGVTSFIDGS